LAGQVRHKTSIDLEQHLGRAVAQLAGDPERVLATGQPERRGGMPGLVGTSLCQIKVAQQGIPDPFGDIVVVERIAFGGAEDVLAASLSELGL